MRDESQKQRTCVAAKAALFSSLSDELRRVIGNMPILEKFSNSDHQEVRRAELASRCSLRCSSFPH